VSLLNYVSTTAPTNIADVLIHTINLCYHPTLMGAAGKDAAAIVQDVRARGNYILAVEGGIPTAYNGFTCIAWTDASGQEVTLLDAVRQLAPAASRVLSIGTCAAFGGIPAAGPNPTGIQSLQSVAGTSTINISGCPTHPNSIIWVIAQLLAGQTINLDANGRPSDLYPKPVHFSCPRLGTVKADTYGMDNHCMMNMGCLGPLTFATCPSVRWNNGVNWCVDSNSQCIGCTEPNFPMTGVRRPGGYNY
jgi:hydrogenase small subunit